MQNLELQTFDEFIKNHQSYGTNCDYFESVLRAKIDKFRKENKFIEAEKTEDELNQHLKTRHGFYWESLICSYFKYLDAQIINITYINFIILKEILIWYFDDLKTHGNICEGIVSDHIKKWDDVKIIKSIDKDLIIWKIDELHKINLNIPLERQIELARLIDKLQKYL